MLNLLVSLTLLACTTGGSAATCATTTDCDALEACYADAYARIDSCTDASECGLSDDGESLATSGDICDGSGVVRLDAALTEVDDLRARASQCEWANLGAPAVCDSYDGFVCDEGRCDAGWLNR